MRWVHILVLVLVEIVVEIVERLVTLVPVQVNGVRLGHVSGFKRAGHQGHELAEYADAAVPEGWLRQSSSESPRARRRVVGFHHIRQLKRVVVTTRHVQFTAQDCHTASNVDLDKRNEIKKCSSCCNTHPINYKKVVKR